MSALLDENAGVNGNMSAEYFMGFTSVTTAGQRDQTRNMTLRPVMAAMKMAAFLLALTCFPSAYAAGDAAAGADKAHTCLGCHGIQHYVNTYPTYHVPRIAGQHAEYLIAALQAYRAKTRSHPTMQANAALLSDDDIQDIAAWFAAQGVSN